MVIRKGRENYLCLLNFAEALPSAAVSRRHGVALGLMARWAGRSRDGDMVGGDFPAWLTDLLGRSVTRGLADRRGECIYSACPHYGKCTIERSIRRARRAEVVVANHALVMIQAALGGEDGSLPTHIVFDEGHHVFDAALLREIFDFAGVAPLLQCDTATDHIIAGKKNQPQST